MTNWVLTGERFDVPLDTIEEQLELGDARTLSRNQDRVRNDCGSLGHRQTGTLRPVGRRCAEQFSRGVCRFVTMNGHVNYRLHGACREKPVRTSLALFMPAVEKEKSHSADANRLPQSAAAVTGDARRGHRVELDPTRFG